MVRGAWAFKNLIALVLVMWLDQISMIHIYGKSSGSQAVYLNLRSALLSAVMLLTS